MTVPRPPSRRRADRQMFVVIAAMVVAWALILVCRHPIRAHWWTRRLAAAADPEKRLIYLQRLVALGPTGATAVETLLNDPDAAIRGLGVALVNHTRPRRARRLLVEMMTDPDTDVSAMAVTGLALLGDAAVVEDLARLLASPDPHRAVLAVSGLGRLRTADAIDLLIETARAHNAVAARVQAIEELGQLQAQRAVEVLTECLKDDTAFEGLTASERSAGDLLARAAPGTVVDQPAQTRPVSYFAARALRATTGRDVSTNGMSNPQPR